MRGKRPPLSMLEDAYLYWCQWRINWITYGELQRAFRYPCLEGALRRYRRHRG